MRKKVNVVVAMENGKIIKLGEDIYRILSVKEEKTLLIDCKTMTMPKWKSMEVIKEAVPVSETECDILKVVPSEAELSQKEITVAHHRFSLIAPVLSVLDDDKLRSSVINKICSDNHISRRTLTDYLCRYLVYGEIAVLAGNRNHQEKELTADQKNMRWALNKFYYTRHKNSLADSYIMMLKAKYTDGEGKLAEAYPSIHQFRYFYKKYNKRQTEIISREGIKEYSLNYRPLLGEGIHDLAPVIGYDASIALQEIEQAVWRDFKEKSILAEMGLQERCSASDNGKYRKWIDDEGCERNGIYKWMFRADFRSGLWNLELYHTSSVYVPEEMRRFREIEKYAGTG